MDNRPPRPLLNNNSTMQGPQQPSTLYQPPSSSQPPVQIPFSDPFQRRAPDPFMPNPQSHQRRDSYGMPSGGSAAQPGREGPPPLAGGGHGDRPNMGGWQGSSGPGVMSQHPTLHHHAGQGPPPPPSLGGSRGPTPPSHYHAAEQARRRSISGHSPPKFYGSSAETQHIPASFGGRQMPPPSPSQTASIPHNYAGPRGPPAHSNFPSGRDLPGLSRPAFPLSSILGGESAHSANNRHSPPSTRSPSLATMHPPRGQSLGSRVEFSHWNRPHTPDQPPQTSSARMADVNPVPSPHHPTTRGSPEFARSGAPPGHQPYAVAPPQQGRPYQAFPHDPREPSRHTDEQIPPRPSSQPAGFAVAPREDVASAMAPRPPLYGAPSRPETDRSPYAGPLDRPGPPVSSYDRPVTVQPTSGYQSPQQDQRQDMHMREELQRKEDYGHFRPIFRNPYGNPTQAPPSGPEPPRSHPQHLDPFQRPIDTHAQPSALDAIHGVHRSGMHSQPPERTEQQPDGTARTAFYEPQARAPGEPMQRSRSFLSGDRRGRASPLPQAVQGAQAQLSGPSGDPSIKSEFGRIFQGLGSGLGGHIPGSSTPSRQSPLPGHRNSEDYGASHGGDPDATKMSRIGSRGGTAKKGRRVKDEDRMNLDNDGRGTPSGRGNKRSRVGHHHHLPHAQPHHHHVHGHAGPRGDEDLQILPQQPTQFLNRFAPASVTPTGTPHHHHHHHVHQPPHHHHHPPKQAQPPQPAPPPFQPLPRPTVSVKSQPVLDSVKALPRRHLGSEVYSPTVSSAPPTTPGSAHLAIGKSLLSSSFTLHRRFTDQDINCTYTIRVPRYHLASEARERVCADRRVWGSEIYTDDSDPLLAAIHSGWVAGEWGDDVDATMLDVPAEGQSDNSIEEHLSDETAITSSPSSGPLSPPPFKDLHITILILPTLQRYPSSVLHGLKSRAWGPEGALHDGLSFTVHSIRFVDEGISAAGVGRDAESRRRRAAARALVNLRVWGQGDMVERGDGEGEEDTEMDMEKMPRGGMVVGVGA